MMHTATVLLTHPIMVIRTMRHDERVPLLRCYVASPLGFTTDGLRLLSDVYVPALEAVVMPVNPWDLTASSEIAAAERAGTLPELRSEMGRRNADAIESSELLVAYLEGQELDSGTAAEVGYAAALGKRCYGLRTDLRQTGEPHARVNLQVEYFIARSGGTIVGTLDELLSALKRATTELGPARVAGTSAR